MKEEIGEVKNVVECQELKPKRRGRPPYKNLKNVEEAYKKSDEQTILIFENSPLSKPMKDYKFAMSVSGINNSEEFLDSEEVKEKEVMHEDLFKEFIKIFELTYIPNKYACIKIEKFIEFCNKYKLDYNSNIKLG